ncbi:hypothetical protein HDU85_007771 [Gaertneriomyces sp. JEL0708]|nr:hypothetical protein HDU85_007771 [Gaertneriomyces sp. JEL0708]
MNWGISDKDQAIDDIPTIADALKTRIEHRGNFGDDLERHRIKKQLRQLKASTYDEVLTEGVRSRSKVARISDSSTTHTKRGKPSRDMTLDGLLQKGVWRRLVLPEPAKVDILKKLSAIWPIKMAPTHRIRLIDMRLQSVRTWRKLDPGVLKEFGAYCDGLLLDKRVLNYLEELFKPL